MVELFRLFTQTDYNNYTNLPDVTNAKSADHSDNLSEINLGSSSRPDVIIKKCFSNRLISGMGNDSYTTCLFATTINLEKNVVTISINYSMLNL